MPKPNNYHRARKQNRTKKKNRLKNKVKNKPEINNTKYADKFDELGDEALNKILIRNIHGKDPLTIQNQIDELKRKNELDEKIDKDKYEIGRRYALSIPQEDLYSMNNDRRMDDIDLAKKYRDKNLDSFLKIHKKAYDHLLDIRRKRGKKVDKYPGLEKIKQELLDDFIQQHELNTPYYYGTKQLREPYTEQDAIAYEKQKRDWDDFYEILYEHDEKSELVPLSPNELGIDPKFLYPLTEQQKKEYENYYYDNHDILSTKMRFMDERENWKGIDGLLEMIKDYYDGPTIIGCLETRNQKLDQITKSVKNYGMFSEKYISSCTDNKRLTEVYIRNFEKLPPELIMPKHQHIKDLLIEIPGFESQSYYSGRNTVNRYLPNCIKMELLNILQKLGLYNNYIDFKRYNIGNRKSGVYINPTNSLFMLSQIFKRMKKDKQQIFTVNDMMTIPKKWPHDIYMIMQSGEDIKSESKHEYPAGDGIDMLRLILTLLEESYNDIMRGKRVTDETQGGFFNTQDDGDYVRKSPDFDIEKTKRFLILIFMGIVVCGNDDDDDYVDRLMNLDHIYNNKLSTIYTEMRRFNTGLPNIDEYDENLGRNTGEIIKKEIQIGEYANYENDKIELDFKKDLVDDLKKLFNYFTAKLKEPSDTRQSIKFGQDYKDNFISYYGNLSVY